MNKTIYVLDPYHEDAISLLHSTPGLNVILPDNPSKADWHTKADGVLVRSETKILKDDFEKVTKRFAATSGPSTLAIVKQGAGVDNIDLDAAKAAGVAVHNTPALNSETVAELSLAMALSLSRRVSELDRRLRNGDKVVRSQALGLSLFQKTVGIIGMGNIGRAAATKWCGACDASIIAYDPVAPKNIWGDIPHDRVDAVDDLLRRSDVITLHVPLLASTKHMIGARQLGLLKKNAIIINTARGGLIDEDALLAALQKRNIWGAVLDACEKEPVTRDGYDKFFELDNVIFTPHVGASTMENQSKSGVASAQALLDLLRGKQDVAGKQA